VKKPFHIRPRADLDLARHYDYLCTQNPRTADQFLVAVRIATQRIKSHPSGGTMLHYPGLPDVALRFCRPPGFRKYLVIYQITDDCVFLVRILHGSQNLAAELRATDN
jgi:plasmid stabilization system protein ParE